MTTTISGASGHGVLLDLGTTRNMQIAGQLASMISSGFTGTGDALSARFGDAAGSDTVSPTSGLLSSDPLSSVTSFAASVSGGSLLFLGGAAASATASTAAAAGNTTLGGGLGQGLALQSGVASLGGGSGGQAVLAGGTAAGTDLLAGLAGAVSAAAHVDTASTVQATAGTTVTLSDATRITFQSVVLHSNNH